MYDIMVIDAQWLLTRNYHAIKHSYEGELDENAYKVIASSVIQSIVKLIEELPSRKVILVFDTYPYYKSTMLNDEFKDSRIYVTDEDVEEETDPEKKAELAIEAFNLKQRGKAKMLLKQLSEYGLPSFFKSGYEADDLVYIIASKIKELDLNGVIISIDSDWNYWINENVDWYSPKRGTTTYKDTIDYLQMPEGLSLFEYKRLYDSFYGSHNDYRQTVKDELYEYSFNDFYKMFIESKDRNELFSDYEKFLAQYDALGITEYPEFNKVQSMMYYIDKSGSIPSQGQWEMFSTKNGLTVNASYFNRLLKYLDSNFYQDK
jgi:hypothetical protein